MLELPSHPGRPHTRRAQSSLGTFARAASPAANALPPVILIAQSLTSFKSVLKYSHSEAPSASRI